jgi:pimeloyl-ACP methyl ester carboxylesterase
MSSARSWTGPFCKKLQQNQFFTLRYDHRDVGESSSVDWKKDPYSISDLAKDAIRILDAYGIEKAHAIGHSMGGYICQQLAIEFPHRLHSIATIGSGPLGATKETDQPLTLKEQATLFQTWHLLMKEKKASTLEEEVESFCHVWRHLNGKIPLDEEMAKDYTRDLLIRTNHPIQKGNNHQLLMQDLLDSLGKRRDILQKIQLPTLVIHGEEDPLILPRMGKALAHAIEGAKLTMIPRMGHMFLNRELESELSQLLCNHLKKIL